MKVIVINALSALRGGGQTYIINLLKHFPAGDVQAVVLVCSANRMIFSQFATENIRLHEVEKANRGIFGRTLWEVFYLPEFLKKNAADVYYAPGGIMLTRMPEGVVSATALRNMLPFDKRERQRFGLFSFIRFKLWLLRYIFLLSYKMADKVVFISEYSRQVVRTYIPAIDQKSCLIPHGLNQQFLTPQVEYELPDFLSTNQFYLYVSILDVYKAQKEVVQAWKQLIQQGFEYPLVLVGPKYNDYGESVLALISKPEFKDKIFYLGKVEYQQLPGLYQAARALIFASSCECCPNILLEKLAAGRPVLCSNIEPMPEFGEDAVVYFDPYNPDSLVREVQLFENEPGKMATYSQRASQQAEKFDWEQTVRKTVDFLFDNK